MRNLLFILLLATSVGCHSSAVNRLTGQSDSKAPAAERAHEFIPVACCMDNNASGTPTYPAFLPTTQVQLCKTAKTACHDADCQINGDTYLPIGVGCGQGFGYRGDEYYPAGY